MNLTTENVQIQDQSKFLDCCKLSTHDNAAAASAL